MSSSKRNSIQSGLFLVSFLSFTFLSSFASSSWTHTNSACLTQIWYVLWPRAAPFLVLFFFPVGKAKTLQSIFSDICWDSFHFVFVRLSFALNLAFFALVLVSEYPEVDRIATALDKFLLDDCGKLTETGTPGVFAVRTGVPYLSLNPFDRGALWVGHSLDFSVVELIRSFELEFVSLNFRCN